MNKKTLHTYLLNDKVDQLTAYLVKDEGLSIEEAMKKVYTSRVYEMLQVPDNYLLSQSPGYVYEIMKEYN